MLQDLLSTKRKTVVHFAMDLYAILLGGQRFLADIEEIEKGLKSLIRRNHGRSLAELELSFEMRIGKNNELTNVCINRQFCMMLIEFGWEGFNKRTARIVARMKSWLGVRGYYFKHAMLTAAASSSSDLRLAQHIAGHKSISSTKVYTKLAALADAMRLS